MNKYTPEEQLQLLEIKCADVLRKKPELEPEIALRRECIQSAIRELDNPMDDTGEFIADVIRESIESLASLEAPDTLRCPEPTSSVNTVNDTYPDEILTGRD